MALEAHLSTASRVRSLRRRVDSTGRRANKIFITGIEGFVGTYLVSHLLSKKYRVTGIHFAPLPANFPPDSGLATHQGSGLPRGSIRSVKVYHCDITDKKQLKESLARENPDAVFHLAAISSVGTCEHCAELAFEINTQGTFYLLESLQELAINPKTILISSCEVYETKSVVKKGKTRFNEKSATRPSSVYALTKICAESVANFFFNRYGLKTTILRPFTHTGPGQSENFVFPSVAKQIVEIERGKRPPLIELGNINVIRDYTDVRDMVKAYELALRYCLPGEIYNITSEQTYSIRQGIEILLKLAQKPIEIKTVPGKVRPWENQYLVGDCRKFRAATKWKPEIDFKTTLADLLEYSRRTIKD